MEDINLIQKVKWLSPIEGGPPFEKPVQSELEVAINKQEPGKLLLIYHNVKSKNNYMVVFPFPNEKIKLESLYRDVEKTKNEGS